MRISVVVIAFNEEKYLGKYLDSINNQTLAPDEVIVVDNNSTDKTVQIAKNKGAIVIKEKMQGASFARDAGFNYATGDIILKTDADTVVPRFWIEKMSEEFKDPGVGIVAGGVKFYKKWTNPFSHVLIYWNNDIFGFKAVTGPNFAIRKSVWEKIKNEVHHNDKKFHEDLDLSIHAMPFGKYIRRLDIKVESSPRKVGNFKIFFIEYPYKWLYTVFLKEHRKLSQNKILRLI